MECQRDVSDGNNDSNASFSLCVARCADARCGVEVEDIYRTLNALLFMLILHYNIFGE